MCQEQHKPQTDNTLLLDFSDRQDNTGEYSLVNDSQNREHSENSNGTNQLVDEDQFNFSNMSVHFNTPSAARKPSLFGRKSLATSTGQGHDNDSKVKSLINLFDGSNNMQKNDPTLP